jgi:hypothetical protein
VAGGRVHHPPEAVRALVDARLIELALFVGMLLNAAMWAPSAAFVPELFSTPVWVSDTRRRRWPAGPRHPLVSVVLLCTTGSGTAVAGYVAGMLALSVLAVVLARPCGDPDIQCA